VSFYIDQFPENDIGVAVAAENGIEIYRSIKAALCLGGSTCAVDGVICIGEHGEYAENEKGQAMFPRRYFFEQVRTLPSQRQLVAWSLAAQLTVVLTDSLITRPPCAQPSSE
jgi:hypothetical protein